MAEKDITEKLLEDYNDVFADIINVLVFNGEPVVDEQDLETDFARSQYKAGTIIHSQERDVSKFWRQQKVKFALLGFENQSERDPDIALRLYGYDGASYRDELNHGDERYLVFTFVLYFGTEHRWGQKSRSLFKRIGSPRKELKPFANDYHVNVFEIAWLSDETVAKFKSDFRIVADYFVQKRKNKNYIPSTQQMKHVEEVLNLMYAVTGDHFFEDAQNETAGKEVTTMSQYYNSLWDQIHDGVKKEVRGEIREEVREEIRGEVREEVRGEVREEVRGEVREEVRGETVNLFLETCVEDGNSYDTAIRKLKKIYQLSQNDAEKYARKYYPKSKRTNLQPA